MNNIEKVGIVCVGCRSCEQICPKKCIDIVPNREGFLYPVVQNESCVNCGACLKHCPAQGKRDERRSLAVYALKNKDEQRIFNSASGGAADLAAQYILSLGGVVYGCAYTKNLYVEHIQVLSVEDLWQLQSSKYVQSDLKNCYAKAKQKLESGDTVLFTGTPCQIDGLYSFLGKKEYDNLYTVDLICHGVPSPLFLEKYFVYMSEKMGGSILEYNFRSKDKQGWGTQYLIKTKKRAKTKAIALDKYGKHFMDGDCYRECCYLCRYANTNRVGDITVGDFWGIDQCHPEFSSPKGVSSILVNTSKGQKLFNAISKNAEWILSTLDYALIKQGNLMQPALRTKKRDVFYENVDKQSFISDLKVGLCLKERVKVLLPKRTLTFLKRKL